MSGFALIFQRHGQPVAPIQLKPSLEALRHRGPDGWRVWSGGEVCLGHLHFWTTPEEVGERQPLSSRDGQRILAWDGRLDNREELWRALPSLPESLSTSTDGNLVLRALETWGEGALPKLLGSYALAFVDLRKRQVILARDAMGSRGLSFHLTDRVLIAASEDAGVLAQPQVSDELDEERLAVYFSFRELSDGKTFFREVRHLLPGRSLCVSREKVRENVFWKPAATLLPARLRDEDFEEAFREAFVAAVRSRCRSREAPAVLLSGGLDSSPIAAVAANRAPAGSVQALCWTFQRHPSCDEGIYQQAVCDRAGLQAVSIPCDDGWPLAGHERWPVHPTTPEQNAYRWFHQRSFAAAAHQGRRVVLSGMCGDQLYAASRGWLAELMGEGRWREAWAEAVASRRNGDGWRFLARGLLPDRWLMERPSQPPWLTPEANATLAGAGPNPCPFQEMWRPSQCRRIFDPMNAHGLVVESYYANRAGVEMRYPFRDRRLVELALALPARLLFSRRLSRPILRRAARSCLPEEVQRRKGKTSFEPVFREGIFDREQARVQALLTDPDAGWRRFIRADWLDTRNQGMATAALPSLVLWFAVSFELWQQKRRGAAFEVEPLGEAAPQAAVGW